MRGWAAVVVAWALAMGGAAGGVLSAGVHGAVALSLDIAAAVLGLAVGVALITLGRRESRAWRAKTTRWQESPLARLDHLPDVTTPVRRSTWRGSRYWRIRADARSAAGAPHADVAQPRVGDSSLVKAVPAVDDQIAAGG